jgi:uncharacterized protein (TIRG00374 family)
MSSDYKRYLSILIKLFVTGALLWAVFYNVKFAEFWSALLKTNKLSLLLCIFFFGIGCLLRAFMWRSTTLHIQRVGISTLFGGVVVGYMANNIFPFRAGEIVRTYYLASRTKISASAALSTIFIERIYDVFSLTLLLLVGMAYGMTGLNSDTVKIVLIFMGGIIIAASMILTYLVRLNGLSAHRVAFLAQMSRRLGIFLNTIAQLKQSKMIVILLMLSMGAWASNYLSVLSLIHGSSSSDVQPALLLLLFVNIGLLIPSSPGSLGVMQVAFLFALSPFGIAKKDALALSFAYQTGLYFFTLSLGLPFFMRTNLRFGNVRWLDFWKSSSKN